MPILPERVRKSIAKLSESVKKLFRKPAPELRRATPTELRKMGASPKSKRYVRADLKRVTANTPSISERQYYQKKYQESGEAKTKEERASKLRSGEISYESRATEERAISNRRKAEQKRLEKRVHEVSFVKDGKGRDYRPGSEALRRYFELRERHLEGEWLGDDWFEMIDIAEAVKDHALPRLRQSGDRLSIAVLAA